MNVSGVEQTLHGGYALGTATPCTLQADGTSASVNDDRQDQTTPADDETAVKCAAVHIADDMPSTQSAQTDDTDGNDFRTYSLSLISCLRRLLPNSASW